MVIWESLNNLKNWISLGNTYLGICCGGYLAMPKITFDNEIKNQDKAGNYKSSSKQIYNLFWFE